ncbi:hypothetical protein U9M48_039658 [Paspalum notatum var. saurae]|uniref:Uncharacterized protein n=1 Tax=Paspalum notatum var. saurae TaxID=547442 RepID=A0AAQ3UNT2_PASNO
MTSHLGLGPIFYLGESEPNPPSHLNLGGGFEPKPLKPPSHAFAPCTRVGAPRWHPASPVHRSHLTVHSYPTVAELPLRVPSCHGRPRPSIVFDPLKDFCLSPSRSSSSTSSPSEGLQSIGSLELVDNHSSHQESNETGTLALTRERRPCSVFYQVFEGLRSPIFMTYPEPLAAND